VRVYSYSSESLTFVEAKWTLAKLATGGILMGVILLFAFMELNQSVGNAIGSRSTTALKTENSILRQQMSLIAPRVSKLEARAVQLEGRANELHKLLRRHRSVRHVASSFKNAAEGSKKQSLMAAAKDPLP
jgi:hypothetical protein